MTKVPVEDADIDEMFAYADKNCDGKLSYSEFEVTRPKLGTHSLDIFRCYSGDGESAATSRGAKASHIRYWDGSPGWNLQPNTIGRMKPTFSAVLPTLPIFLPCPIRLRLPSPPNPQAFLALLLQGLYHLPINPGGYFSDTSQ